MALVIAPSPYPCPTHRNVNLEERIKDKLSVRVLVPESVRAKVKAEAKSPFLVVITCPGDATDGKPHDLQCPGTFWTA